MPSTMEIVFPFRIGVVISDKGENEDFFSDKVEESFVNGTRRFAESST